MGTASYIEGTLRAGRWGLIVAFAVAAAGAAGPARTPLDLRGGGDPVAMGAAPADQRDDQPDAQPFANPERQAVARVATRERRGPAELPGAGGRGALAAIGPGPRVARVSRVACAGAAWAARIVPFAFRSPRGPPASPRS
jgi:hypothetical protein